MSGPVQVTTADQLQFGFHVTPDDTSSTFVRVVVAVQEPGAETDEPYHIAASITAGAARVFASRLIAAADAADPREDTPA